MTPIISRDTTTIVPVEGGKITSGTVYVSFIDENNNPVDGGGATVTIVQIANGIDMLPVDYTVSGSTPIFTGVTLRQLADGTINPSNEFKITKYSEAPAHQPAICDGTIDSVTINKKETFAGANDGQVTINARASYGSILYKFNDRAYQSSPLFTNVSGGINTAYIQNGACPEVSYAFTLPTTKNLLVSDPSVNIGNNNISRWSAAFNPVTFTYQRKDFEVTNIIDFSGAGGTFIAVNGYTGKINNKDMVYVNAGAYKGVYEVIVAQDAGVVIKAPYVSSASATGFMNSNTVCSYYNVKTNITYQDRLTGRTNTIISTNRPDSTGLVRADLSSFLQSLLRAKDESDYTETNFRDGNLSASYSISYQENWIDVVKGEQSSAMIHIADPWFVTYSAKQLGEKHGGNMAAYVPFKSVDSADKRAKWITDFAEPAYSAGYPFDLSFIYSEDLIGLNLYYEVTMLDINRNPIPGSTPTSYLLNNDATYLLNEDRSRFVIANGTLVSTPVSLTPNQLGLNRILLNPALPDEARYFTIVLKYDDAAGTHTITQEQTVRVDDAVEDKSVYLRWIGLTGSWNYYRFVFNQEISLDVQNAVIIKNYVTDWENQQGIEEVISKSAGEKMKVMAEDLSVADIKGLQSIKYSPKVQLLVNRNPVKWQTVVLNSATFAEYETRYGQYAFNVTFNLPAKNIQTQ